MAKKPKAKKGPSLFDVLRLGAEVAQVKSSLKPKQWRQIVNTAHTKGYTVGGYLSDAPDAMKERLPKVVNAEAKRTVATAYKPVYANLSADEKAAQAMDAKRKADNAYYQQWVQNQYDKIQQQSLASNQALAAAQAGIQQSSQQAWSQGQQAAMAAAASQAGNVSNPADSAAMAQIPAAAAYSQGLIANARQQSADIMGASAAQQKTGQEAAVAQAAMAEAQRQGDAWKALGDIAKARRDTKAKQAADTVTERSRLQGVERENAQSNREYAAAAEKLGIQSAEIKAKALKDQRDYRLATKKFNLERFKAQHKAEYDQAQIDMGYEEIRRKRGKAAADRELERYLEQGRNERAAKDRAAANKRAADKRKADAKKDNGPGGAKITDGQRKRSQDLYTNFTNYMTYGRRVLQAEGGAKDKAAVARTRVKLRNELKLDGSALNIAMDLAVFGHLSPPNIRAAQNMGLIIPKEWLG